MENNQFQMDDNVHIDSNNTNMFDEKYNENMGSPE